MSNTSDFVETTGATFELEVGPYARGEIAVVSFHGTERMSRPFSFEVLATIGGGRSGIRAGDDLIGKRVCLWIEGTGRAPRAVRGIVASVQLEGVHLHDRTAVRLGIAPRLSLLKRRKGSRIFQDMSAVAVIDQVLGEWNVTRDVRLIGSYPKRSYCVQYQESDFAFVTRLLAEEGIFFFFAHPPEGNRDVEEILVLADDKGHYPTIDGHPTLVYRAAPDSPGMPLREHHVTRFATRTRLRPEAVLLRDYDFRRPKLDLSASALLPESNGRARVYEHHGNDQEPDVARDTATSKLEQHRRRAEMVHGESICRRLLPGSRFHLDEHDIPTENREYVVTRVDHKGRSGETSRGEREYENRFECVHSGICFRPPRPRRKVAQVVETAVVVGPQGSEIHTDEHGRIKVQVHWDLYGHHDERSSCFLRVSQTWAGTGWGFQFIPRVGMEVLVTFLGGDVDRPIVTGCVYNALNPPTYALPQGHTISAIRTQSTPGGDGFNELSFDDRKGKESVHLRAERDLREHVLHDHSLEIGHQQSIHVGAAQHQTVEGDQTENIHGDQRVNVAGNRTEAVGKDRSQVVHGDQRDETKGRRQVTVHGRDERTVHGPATDTIEKDFAIHVNGFHSVAVGLGSEHAKGTYYVRGDYLLGAAGIIKVSSDKALLLQCGESLIEITPKKIRLSAAEVEIVGARSASLTGNGPAVSLGESAEIVAKKLKILTPDASLELDRDARLDGKRVLLNCKDIDKPKNKDANQEPEETRQFKLTVKDPELLPYADKRYALLVDGLLIEGKTSADGLIDQKIPKNAERADLTLWIDEWPTGKKLTWRFDLAELPPVESLNGAQVRLKNLGYYEGEPSGKNDEATRIALVWFQKDHKLEPTGELDDATRAALGSAHGH